MFTYFSEVLIEVKLLVGLVPRRSGLAGVLSTVTIGLTLRSEDCGVVNLIG